MSRNLITSGMLSVGPVQKGLTWAAEESSFVCCGPRYRDCLGEESLPHLKESYRCVFDDVEEDYQFPVKIVALLFVIHLFVA